MRGPSADAMRWLLLSELHFKCHDLDRVRQTAQWIVAEAERNQVGRAREYVESLDLDESPLLRRDDLLRVGQRKIPVSREIAD
ncbi:hypothetical protein FOWG_16785 [Fusarium oxysporum f. sp. lycopersici MN25]|nr:hypothetical protein FOWG_16785 [Fusarium oxysporum f. sp. lycopersici MN25]